MEKLSSTKPVPGGKKVGDRCSKALQDPKVLWGPKLKTQLCLLNYQNVYEKFNQCLKSEDLS